jgi:hypothetical protein
MPVIRLLPLVSLLLLAACRGDRQPPPAPEYDGVRAAGLAYADSVQAYIGPGTFQARARSAEGASAPFEEELTGTAAFERTERELGAGTAFTIALTAGGQDHRLELTWTLPEGQEPSPGTYGIETDGTVSASLGGRGLGGLETERATLLIQHVGQSRISGRFVLLVFGDVPLRRRGHYDLAGAFDARQSAADRAEPPADEMAASAR